jgi:hypothetical protein
MKNKNFKISILLLTLTIAFFACEPEPESTDLKGTKWKLAGIVNANGDILREPEPKHYGKCYTLDFGTKVSGMTAVGYTATSRLFIRNLNPFTTEVSRAPDSGYSSVYKDAFLSVKSYTHTQDKLKLFYGNSGNYLLYKPYTIDPVITNLKGTKWKLVSVFDRLKSELKKLEPKHCEECYTLNFETDYCASYQSITCVRELDLLHLLENIPDEYNNSALWCEYYSKDSVAYCDSYKFREGMAFTMSYIIAPNELRLFTTSNDLLFKPIKTTEQ